MTPTREEALQALASASKLPRALRAHHWDRLTDDAVPVLAALELKDGKRTPLPATAKEVANRLRELQADRNSPLYTLPLDSLLGVVSSLRATFPNSPMLHDMVGHVIGARVAADEVKRREAERNRVNAMGPRQWAIDRDAPYLTIWRKVLKNDALRRGDSDRATDTAQAKEFDRLVLAASPPLAPVTRQKRHALKKKAKKATAT